MNRSALNSRREELYYQSVIQHYLQSPQRNLPALPYEVCIYLAECYACGNVRLLKSKLLAIGRWHTENGFPDPTECRSVMRLTQLIRAATELKANALKPPPTISDVKCITDVLQQYYHYTSATPHRLAFNQKSACRNRAIWLIAFWFGLNTSDVCRLRRRDVHLDQNSLTITTKWIGGQGEEKFSFRLTRLPIICPVSALDVWLGNSTCPVDYLFPRTSHKSLTGPVSSRSVHAFVKKLMAATPGASANTSDQHYSLYFFLAANGWSRREILEILPFYKMSPSKTRILKTKNRLDLENVPPWLSDSDMLTINQALMASQTHK
jgi:hypothetical protein